MNYKLNSWTLKWGEWNYSLKSEPEDHFCWIRAQTPRHPWVRGSENRFSSRIPEGIQTRGNSAQESIPSISDPVLAQNIWTEKPSFLGVCHCGGGGISLKKREKGKYFLWAAKTDEQSFAAWWGDGLQGLYYITQTEGSGNSLNYPTNYDKGREWETWTSVEIKNWEMLWGSQGPTKKHLVPKKISRGKKHTTSNNQSSTSRVCLHLRYGPRLVFHHLLSSPCHRHLPRGPLL